MGVNSVNPLHRRVHLSLSHFGRQSLDHHLKHAYGKSCRHYNTYNKQGSTITMGTNLCAGTFRPPCVCHMHMDILHC